MLFSPGLGDSRLHYSILSHSLASQGFIVIAMDHPYDADVVEFPDGSTVLGVNLANEDSLTIDQIQHRFDVRVQDVSFVLDQLASPHVRRRLFGFNDWKTDPCNIIMYGHSLGGATAVASAWNDTRLVASVNLDGRQYGSQPALGSKQPALGSKQPIMLVASEIHTATNDPTWVALWNATQQTTKAMIKLNGTNHKGLSDFPLIVGSLPDYTDLPQTVRDVLTFELGTMSGARVDTLLPTLVARFLSYAIGQASSPLPDLGDGNYPDVYLLENTVLGRS